MRKRKKGRRGHRIKFEIHVRNNSGKKASKAKLQAAVKAWIDGDDDSIPEGYEVDFIRWQNNNQAWRKSDDPDRERAWLGRLLPWATLQISQIRTH